MRIVLCIITLAVLLSAGGGVFAAQEFVPIVGIPGIPTTDSATLGDYANGLFRVLIGVGLVLAVIYLVIAGFEYMTSEALPTKDDAKKRLSSTLYGLLLLLSAYLLLNVINPDITSLKALENIGPLSGGAQNTGNPRSGFQGFTGIGTDNTAGIGDAGPLLFLGLSPRSGLDNSTLPDETPVPGWLNNSGTGSVFGGGGTNNSSAQDTIPDPVPWWMSQQGGWGP